VGDSATADLVLRQGFERIEDLDQALPGAHAAVEGMALLTRDARRYRTYYPTLELICP